VKHWLVSSKRTKNTDTSRLVPRLSRVLKVSILDDRIFRCSCMHFKRIDIPCRHQMHVLCSVCNGYLGVTHHHVCLSWWQEFLAYGFSKDPKCHNLWYLYKQLLFHDIEGPSIPYGIELPPVQQALVDASLALKATKESCLNYNVSTINLALKQSNFYCVEEIIYPTVKGVLGHQTKSTITSLTILATHSQN
jgi:hypothetical protein